MRKSSRFINTLFSFCLLIFFQSLFSQTTQETIEIKGLSRPVEIIKDRWGISHIFAENQNDLFITQGFNAARDRLFQLEIWRRKATGTMAEILGEKALQNDIGSRLFKARVDIQQEMNHYHPDGAEIITSFVRGINAYIDHANSNPETLPLEFRLLGIRPLHWTPEVVVSRHNGLYRNAGSEVTMARRIEAAGLENIQPYLNLEPGNPQLEVAKGLDLSLIPGDVLNMYNASRRTGSFTPDDIIDASRRRDAPGLESEVNRSAPASDTGYEKNAGSNNWVVSGKKSFSGFPILANDPHRSQQIPSLRYCVHLSAPGWNVIGGGEPALPGVSIGHNDYGAWGLTIFSTDQEDLYIYEINPDNPDQYRYRDHWENMSIVKETFNVKNSSPVTVELRYTRHGPVVFEDDQNKRAYALRAAWLEAGGAPYLASLRMDQAKSWGEFREACSFSHTPSENMIWADIYGNIGWQAVGITPIRKNWYGLLPVPGDGRYEWDGYLPILELPHSYNPPEEYIATANQNNVPPDYPYRLGYSWAGKFRFNRIAEVLESGRRFTIMDMMMMQHDELSIPARTLIPLLRGLTHPDEHTRKALDLLLEWDYVMSRQSIAAAVYSTWERTLSSEIRELFVPEKLRNSVPRPSLKKIIDILTAPDGIFGQEPIGARDKILIQSLARTVEALTDRLGVNMENWQYGQERFHHIRLRHMLSRAVNEETGKMLNAGPLPRGGNGNTVNQTGNGNNQTSGASFRIIVDTGDWDNSVGTNNPGQSGNPADPHYRDLFGQWADGKYFPFLFSRSKIENAAETTTIIRPVK